MVIKVIHFELVLIYLTLALLMFWVRTNYHNATTTANDATLFTNFPYRGSNFHSVSDHSKLNILPFLWL